MLAATIENLNDVPEADRFLYVENPAGGFIIDADVENHPSVAALSNAHRRSEKRGKEIAAEVAVLREMVASASALEAAATAEGVTPGEYWKKMKTQERERFAAEAPDEAALLARMEAEHAIRIAEKDSQIKRKEKLLRTLEVRGTVHDALVAAGVRPKLLKGAQSLFEQDHEFLVHLNGAGLKPYVQIVTAFGKISVTEAMRRWVATPDGKAFIAPSPAERHASDDGSFASLIRALR